MGRVPRGGGPCPPPSPLRAGTPDAAGGEGNIRDTQVSCFPGAERRARFFQEMGMGSWASSGDWGWGAWEVGSGGVACGGLSSQTSFFPSCCRDPPPAPTKWGEVQDSIFEGGGLAAPPNPQGCGAPRNLCPLWRRVSCVVPLTPTKFFDSHSCPLSQ